MEDGFDDVNRNFRMDCSGVDGIVWKCQMRWRVIERETEYFMVPSGERYGG